VVFVKCAKQSYIVFGPSFVNGQGELMTYLNMEFFGIVESRVRAEHPCSINPTSIAVGVSTYQLNIAKDSEIDDAMIVGLQGSSFLFLDSSHCVGDQNLNIWNGLAIQPFEIE